jgi:hypothetical protein
MDKIEITSAQYVDVNGKHASINIIVGEIKISVPLDPNNRHYAEILRQVKEGTLTIKDAD